MADLQKIVDDLSSLTVLEAAELAKQRLLPQPIAELVPANWG
jgi:ribosomal protein L7/L12